VGVCVVFIAAILALSATAADRALLDAIELFSGAIPLLMTAFLLSLSPRAGILGLIFFAAGALATAVGITRALTHVDMTASAIFLISLVACFTYAASDQPAGQQYAKQPNESGRAHQLEAP
jgi:hypothetical protein